MFCVSAQSGNVYFIVAGYMNRGRHEGESGVGLYHYDAGSGTVEEKLFVDTDRSFDLLRRDVEELAYVTEDQSYASICFWMEIFIRSIWQLWR